MGMSTTLYVYDKSKLEKLIKKELKKDDAKVLIDNLSDFGVVHDNSLALLASDYWETYEPFYELSRLVESLCGKDLYNEFEKCEVGSNYNGVNAQEWYDEMTGKELPTHPDDADEII